jgi:hypothetical protein
MVFDTNQKVFEFVVEKLISQGRKSVKGYQCMYRIGNLRCAIGHIIPDELYNIEMEGNITDTIFSMRYTALNEWVKQNNHTALRNNNLLQNLQTLHDQARTNINGVFLCVQFISAVELLATKFDLNTEFLQKLDKSELS